MKKKESGKKKMADFSEEIARRDGLTAERILEKFGVFYQIFIWRRIIPKLKGVTGKEFKIKLKQLESEYRKHYSPYDFYKELKERR